MSGVLDDLGVTLPVLAAPMAGGPTTTDLVVAAARAGGLGFLAAGYKTADAVADQIAAVSGVTDRFGVNLFAPGPVPVDPAAYATYRERLRPLADRVGAPLPEVPVTDDDHWRDKVELLVARPVPVVSFTFAIPAPDVVAALQRVGTIIVQTVTNVAEARAASDAGADVLAVQASGAGGHSGTLTPAMIPEERTAPDLVAAVGAAVDLPLLAAGGISGPGDVAAALGAGAAAVVVGTALLLTPEAGTSAPHRAALQDGGRGDTVVTRAFSGRPARAVPNEVTRLHSAAAPAGYPAIHHLTSPMRRAAAAAGDAELVNLWAGTGYRSAVAAPAAEVMTSLAGAV